MKLRNSYASWPDAIRHIASVVNDFMNGKSGEATLTTSSTTTTISDQRVGINSKIFLQATTANAASEAVATYVSDITNEQFTISHLNNAVADRIFDYKIEG